jgi:CRISPR-associated protein Cas1
VRGIEGCAAGAYFALLSRFFPADAPFPSRSRRPPRDEANALLSFAYTLLTNEFVASIRSHGLDVAAGFFHSKSDRAPALALDLMEPFRSPWADRLVLGLLNHRRIRVSDHFDPADIDGVYLNEEGRKIFFGAFEDMMARRQMTKEGEMSLRGIVDKSVCQFISVLESGAEASFYRAA